MSTLEEIEEAIQKLPPEKILQLGDWLQPLLDDQWDRQIESDVNSGRLAQVASQAIAAHRAGNSTPAPGE